MDATLKWFEDLSPITGNTISSSEEDLLVIEKRKRSNLRITPSVTPKRFKFVRRSSQLPPKSPLFITNGNRAPPRNILERNMRSSYVVKGKEIQHFFKLLDDDSIVQKFLERDECRKFADRYLIAMVFAYFKRCNFELRDYTRKNFFLCLYLSHDMEEDDEDLKYEIFPWSLGPFWREKIPEFLRQKEDLWARMNYRAIVGQMCCEELMSLSPSHHAWSRIRHQHHGGAMRAYTKDAEASFPRGPGAVSKQCSLCYPEVPFEVEVGVSSFYDSTCESLWECNSAGTEASDSTDDILALPKRTIQLANNSSQKRWLDNSIEEE